MAGLFQGLPNPATVKTAEMQQTAPEFYTNYLQDIANLGQNAIQQGGVAGFSPLQQQAFQMAPDIAFAGQGSLGAASQLMGQAGATTVPDVIGDYMNPYTSGVVDEMGRLTQRNVQENILPNLGAGAVGSGQFGSRRQQQLTGQTLRDIQSDLAGRQGQVLQQGYNTAATTAQADLQRALQAGQGFTNLGQEQMQLGQGGLKTLFDLGSAQQKQGQALLDYPMAQTQQFAQLLRGQNIPTGSTTQTTGSEGYQNSPLSQIGGLATLLNALFPGGKKPAGKAGGSVQNGVIKKARGGGVRLADGGMAPAGSEYHDGKGNFYDANGYLVE